MTRTHTWVDAHAATSRLPAGGLALLETLARLHLATPHVLGRLVHRRVDEAARQLQHHGLVAVVHATGRAGRGTALLHLTDLGLATLAAATGEHPRELTRRHGLDAEALARALIGLGPLRASHTLLAGISAAWPSAGKLMAWEQPWRRTFRRPFARSAVTARMPALAVWETADGWPACLLLPDRAAEPVHAWSRRLVLLVQLRAVRPEQVPPLVVATTDDRRRAAWHALFEEAAARQRDALPVAYVATWDEVHAGLSLPSNWRGMVAVRPPLARPVAAAGRPPTRSMRRIPEILGAFMEGSSSAPPADPIGQLAALGLALSPTDRDVLACLARHPFLPLAALAEVTGWSTKWARVRRDRLLALGLLRLLTVGEAGTHAPEELAECTRAGLHLVAAELGLTLDDAVRHHGLAGGGPKDPVGARTRLSSALEHTLGADRVFVCVERTARALRACGRDDALLEWRNAAASARRAMRPDGYGVYRAARCEYGFFLEFDRATEKGRDYRQKLGAYLDLLESGAYRRDYEGFPTILFVTTEPGAKQRIARAVLEAEVGRTARLPLLITTLGSLEGAPEGLTARIWRSARSETCRRWPDGASQ